jgi:hypothetical protein
MSESQYMLDASGHLHRAGVHIGTLNDQDQVVWTKPEHSKFKAAVTRWLSDEAKKAESNETGAPGDGKTGEASGAPAVVKPPAPVQTAPPAQTANEKQRQIAESNSLAAEGARAIAAYQADLQDDLDFAAQTGCPQPPKKNPQFGDKTPAYVEWLKDNRPDKWREKYGVKGQAQVPVKKTNDKGVEEIVSYRTADMATRKTHLTELVETQDSLGADLDWNA